MFRRGAFERPPDSRTRPTVSSRRDFLRASTLAAAAAGLHVALPDTAWAFRPLEHAPRVGDPRLRELAMRALDAARGAGAAYADVRLSLIRSRRFYSGFPVYDEEVIGVGVRALAGGGWGFVSSAVWAPDEMARLGREAAAQASVNNWPGTPPVELSPLAAPASGEWATPVERDAFEVPIEETWDFIRAAERYATEFRNGSASSMLGFRREERTFASTDGAFCSQTLHTALTDGSYFSVTAGEPVNRRAGGRQVPWFNPRGGGHEVLENGGLLELIPGLYEEARRQFEAKPVTIGRYDVVFDASAIASVLSQSIGAAMELDRVRGFEANAGGTSYLSPAAEVLGTAIAAPTVTVHADRTDPGGAATVRWDDEGVMPDEFTLVRDGKAVDYATSREHVGELAAWYEARGTTPRSHGCAAAASATNIPLVQTPNLRLAPAAGSATFESLVSQVSDGIAIVGGDCRMDFRKLTGQGTAEVAYEIKGGKLGRVVSGGAYLMRAPEFWKGVAALGGAGSAMRRGFDEAKGQPVQTTTHTVTAVPALVRGLAVIDVSRRLA